MTEFQRRLEANIRESLRFAVGEVQDDAVAHMVAGVNAVLNHPCAPAPSQHVAPDEDAVETVARRIYEDAHKGMSNIWSWNDRGLDDEHPGTRERYLGYARSAIAATPPPVQHVAVTYTQAEYEEAYELGKRDGYEEAVQEIDQLTGGDGEYRVSMLVGGGVNDERHTPDAPAMIQRIVDRFEVLNLLDDATKTGRDQPDDEEWIPPAHWCRKCLADPAEEQGRHLIDTCVSDACSFKRAPPPQPREVG